LSTGLIALVTRDLLYLVIDGAHRSPRLLIQLRFAYRHAV